MRGLIIDPFAGISGDMFVAALVDLGLPTDWLRELVASLGVGADVRVSRVDRSGIACSQVAFEVAGSAELRHLSDVLEIVRASAASELAKERSEDVFRRLAEAEAAVHGVPVDEVHFHEVGAADSILDVVCGVAGVETLGYDRCWTRPVAIGTGTVAMDHGEYPLPAPATARLLEGLPVRETGYDAECTTPTGAALVAALTGGTPPPSDVVYGRSGYGAGTRDPAGRPNCLRLIEGRIDAVNAAESGGDPRAVYALQADVDDLSPEYVAASRDALMEAGAMDVTVLRVDMKKGRPGARVEALVEEAALQRVLDAFFASTTTIGVRFWRVDRAVLERTEDVIDWRGHEIRVKRVTLPDGSVRTKPEFDDVAAAARAEGLSAHEVRVALREEESQNGSGS